GYARLLSFFSGLLEVARNRICDEKRFVLAVGRFVIADALAAFARGPQRFALAFDVIGHHSRGSFEDVLGRTIVLLQADHAGLRKVTLEFEDVADIGPAP